MAVTLAQLEKAEENAVIKGAYQIAVETSTIFDRITFHPIAGNAYAYETDKVLPGVAFRTVNEAYIESTGVVNDAVEKLTILGGEVIVDRFIEQTGGSDTRIKISDQMAMKIESLQASFADTFFNGDTTANPKAFNGLRRRLIGSQVIDSATAMTNDAFLSELDDLIDAADADAIYMPKALRTPLKALLRKAGGYEYVLSEITGKRELTWNGIPFLDPGKTATKRPILGYDATTGGDMYAIKWAASEGEEGVMGIWNGGLLVDPPVKLQDRPAYMGRIEMYAGLVVQGGTAAARLRGVKK